MIIKRVVAAVATAFLATGAFIAFAATDAAKPEIGKPAPDFTATDINGKTIKLSDYKGKVVVLESFNLGCPFCKGHFESGGMQELQKDLTSKGVVWLIVNSVNPKHPNYKTPDQAKADWAKYKINATTEIQDSDGKVGHLYGMLTTPHMFVIDQSGILVYNGAIDDVSDNPDHDPRKARNYVKEAVGKIQANEKVAVSETKPYGCTVKYAN
jgi:peroxiredoxin